MQFHRCAGMPCGIMVLVLVTIGFGCSRSDPGSDVESQPVAAEVPAGVSGASEPAVEPELPSRPDEPAEADLSVPDAADPLPDEDSQAGGEADTGRGQKVVIDGLLPSGQDASKPGSASVPIPIDAVVVVAEGVGLDPDGALKNAFVQAVRQVVGAYVDAETLVKNDQLVHDKVLTFSRGLVSAYQKISERKRDGLIRVTIRATVRYDKLVADLNSVNIETGKFPGPTLFARLSSQLKSETDAAALFAKALYGGVPESIAVARLVGKPKVVSQEDDEVTLQYDLHLSVDRKRYRAFAARVIPVLEQVAFKKGAVTLESEGYLNDDVILRPDGNLFSYLGGVGGYAAGVPLNQGGFHAIYTTVWCGVQGWRIGQDGRVLNGNNNNEWFSAILVDSAGNRTELARSEDDVVGRYDSPAVLDSPPRDRGKNAGEFAGDTFGPFTPGSGSLHGSESPPQPGLFASTITILVNIDEDPNNPLQTTWRWYQVPLKVVFPDSLEASFERRGFRYQPRQDLSKLSKARKAEADRIGPPLSWRDDALWLLANQSRRLVSRRNPEAWVLTGKGKMTGPEARRKRPAFWRHAGRGIIVDVVFTDDGGKEALRHTLPMAPLGSVSIDRACWIMSPYLFLSSPETHALAAPGVALLSGRPGGKWRLIRRTAFKHWRYSTGMTVSRTMTMKLKDLKSLANVKVTVRRNYAETW